MLTSVAAIKAHRAGERVSFRARVLRAWEVGGRKMCLAGDATALTRVELGDRAAEEGRSYEFRDAVVQEYPSTSLRAGPGGWHSMSLDEGSALVPLAEDVTVSQDESYIDYTYRILSGVQRKKARKEGRTEPWRHPAAGERRRTEGDSRS